MLGTQNLWLFVVSGILLNLTPGQDTFYILGRSIAQGRRAGVLSVLGITSGSAVHTCAVAFGVSVMLASSAHALLAIKLAGGGYLTYLGVTLLFHRRDVGAELVRFTPESDGAIYRAGLLTNLLNPKVALFFMAFLPQFVAPAAESKVLTLLFLGSVFMTTGTLWCLVLAWFGGALYERLQNNASVRSLLQRVSGAVFFGLGVRLATSK